MNGKILVFFFIFSLVEASIQKFPQTNLYQDIFVPKEMVQDPVDELEDDLDFEDDIEIDFKQPLSIEMRKFPSLDSFFHFMLSNNVLKPTTSEESLIEAANFSEFPYEFFSNLHNNSSYVKSNNTWRLNGNVCNSKAVYLNSIEVYQEYGFDFKCEQRIDSEICRVYLNTGSKKYTIHISTFCCPGYELKDNYCKKTSYPHRFLYELFESIEVINRTVTGYLELSEIDLYSDIAQDFYLVFNVVADLLLGDSKTKLTIFLWDNRIFLDKINQLFNSDHYEISEILNEINLILVSHIADLHHPTQSIMSDTSESLQSLGNLRLFSQNIKNISRFFVDCFELDLPNNYFKKLDGLHEYQLVIHKLEEGSLIVPSRQTMFDKLENNILQTTRTFKIFKELFDKHSDLFFNEFSSLESFKTLFIPSDRAFKKLTDNEIESIIMDEKCSLALVKINIVKENVCPKQLFKYSADLETSHELVVENLGTNQIGTYKPWFKTAKINNNKSLFFNNQLIRLSRSSLSVNGIIYAISSLNTENTGLLNQMVESFINKISPSFIKALDNNWRKVVRDNSNNCTLMLPGLKFHRDDNNQNNYQLINDYILRPKFNLYELNNGQVVNSISHKQYLINSIKTAKKSFDLFRYLPKKYFYSKYINCQEIEEAQVSACNSELFFFNSPSNFVPNLDYKSLQVYLKSDTEFLYFNQMMDQCGPKCEHFLLDLEKKSKQNSIGYTLFLPINNFTSKNLILDMKKRFFYETLCESMLVNENFSVKNLLNRVFNSNDLATWIIKSQLYLSKSGLLVHKVIWV